VLCVAVALLGIGMVAMARFASDEELRKMKEEAEARRRRRAAAANRPRSEKPSWGSAYQCSNCGASFADKRGTCPQCKQHLWYK
jgi:rubrerythrin